jgi:hypothetical protein
MVEAQWVEVAWLKASVYETYYASVTKKENYSNRAPDEGERWAAANTLRSQFDFATGLRFRAPDPPPQHEGHQTGGRQPVTSWGNLGETYTVTVVAGSQSRVFVIVQCPLFYIQGGPAEMRFSCVILCITQAIFEIYLYLIRYFKDILL